MTPSGIGERVIKASNGCGRCVIKFTTKYTNHSQNPTVKHDLDIIVYASFIAFKKFVFIVPHTKK